MPDIKSQIFKPAAWLFYLIIGIEILYMISPFAVYYYSTYGPGLNFLHGSSNTAWLTGFFLPHFVKTGSVILNTYQIAGWILILFGLLFFLIGAGQIYFYKFTRKGAVTGGIYKYIRHPQYVAFAIMGLGLLLAWPRFTVLFMYVTMLFAYVALAKMEEKECEQKFGESYRAYKANTSGFIPGDSVLFAKLPALPESGLGKFAVIFLVYLLILVGSVSAAFDLRNYSLTRVSATYSQNNATISATPMSEHELKQILQIALTHQEVMEQLRLTSDGGSNTFLNYVVPAEWHLPDVPLEKTPEGVHGHHQPSNYNRDRYKVLFTKAKLRTSKPVTGEEIIKQTYARLPVVLAYVDRASGEATEIKKPPEHVRWGDIPTPLF